METLNKYPEEFTWWGARCLGLLVVLVVTAAGDAAAGDAAAEDVAARLSRRKLRRKGMETANKYLQKFTSAVGKERPSVVPGSRCLGQKRCHIQWQKSVDYGQSEGMEFSLTGNRAGYAGFAYSNCVF